MRRVLVPLDGSCLSEAILPDARLLAGQAGVLVLVHVSAHGGSRDRRAAPQCRSLPDEHCAYLHEIAGALTLEDVTSELYQLVVPHNADDIVRAAHEYGVDMIACATHGFGPFGRLGIADIAGHILVHSPVPVLLRHVNKHSFRVMSAVSPTQATLMVPLDGSTFAESCLPLTDDLAQEWDASILLAQVVSRLPFAATLDGTSSHDIMGREIIRARTYLKDVAQGLSSPVETQVLLAPRVSDALVQLARDEQVTQVILSSHGRTGLSRLVLGNVAVSLVSHLSCPLIVVPASLAQETEDSVTSTPFPLPSA